MSEPYRHLRRAEELLAHDAAAEAEPAEPAPEPPGEPRPPTLPGLEPGPPSVEALRPLRDWDVVTTAEAPDLTPETVDFTVLPDGSIVIDGEGSGDASPLADSVERRLRAPYRARAIARDGQWTVLARSIDLIRLDEPGEEIELSVNGDERTLLVDGVEESRRVPELEALGAELREGFFVHAIKVDEGLFEVEVMPL